MTDKLKDKSVYLSMFLIGIIVLFCRNTQSIITPYIYAEDGRWISAIFQNGIVDTLINARQDYLVIGNIMLLKLALVLNYIFFENDISNLPIFITIVSYAFFSSMAIVPVVCLKGILNKWGRIFIWIAVLLMPLGISQAEIIGHICNTGYAFAFIAFCLLVYRSFNRKYLKRYQVVFIDLMLAICAFTNPFCYILVGIGFLYEIYNLVKESSEIKLLNKLKVGLRKFYIISMLILLGILFISAIFVIVRGIGLENPYGTEFEVENIVRFIARCFLYNITFGVYNKLNDKLAIVLLIGGILVIGYSYKYMIKKERHLCLATLFSAVFISIMTLVSRPNLTTLLVDYNNTFPDRYFYTQGLLIMVVIGILISTSIRSRGAILKIISVVFVCAISIQYLTGINKIFEFNSQRMINVDETFEEKIIASYHSNMLDNKGYLVDIEPDGWNMWIPERNVVDSIEIPVGMVQAASLNDDNWINGINRDWNIILFESTQDNDRILQGAKKIAVGDECLNIMSIEKVGDNWIYVLCDNSSEIEKFANPNLLMVYK